MEASKSTRNFGVLILVVFFSYFDYVHTKIFPQNLNSYNWKQVLEGEWLLLLTTSWCPPCKQYQHHWEEFSQECAEVGVKTAQIDATESIFLAKKFSITSLPAIFHVINGEFRQYHGPREKNDLMNFVGKTLWRAIKPMPYYMSPASIYKSIYVIFDDLGILWLPYMLVIDVIDEMLNLYVPHMPNFGRSDSEKMS